MVELEVESGCPVIYFLYFLCYVLFKLSHSLGQADLSVMHIFICLSAGIH